jgi:CBS-domain-containing membrane protein
VARRRQPRDDPGMIVNDCMSRAPQRVRVTDRLDAAARVMWDHDCGFVPVLDGADRLVGVVTDRDLCMAAFTQGRPLHELPMAAAMARQVRTVRADDSLATAMAAMQEVAVRRLPVVDAEGRLVGVLSSNDLVRHAHAGHREVAAEHVLRTLAVVGKSRRAAAVLEAAVAATSAGPVPVRGPVEAAAEAIQPIEPMAPTLPKVVAPQRASGAARVRPGSGGKAAGSASGRKVTAGKPAGLPAGKPAGLPAGKPVAAKSAAGNSPKSAGRKVAARRSATGRRTGQA